MKKRYWLAGSAMAAGGATLWALRQKPHRPEALSLELPAGVEPAPSAQGSVQFIGAATTIIRYAGLTILTDPNFLHRGEQVHIGYGMHSTRLIEPALDFDSLPAIDVVLLSHLHEDHFDKLVQKSLARSTPILTTASAARSLRRMGFECLYPLRTWDRVAIRKGAASVRITALPGTHGPPLVSAMLPDVMGSLLDFRNGANGGHYRMYISGDTLVFRDLEEIPRRYPNIDLALLHLGGTRVMGVLLTMDAQQGIEALRIVRPELAIPIHFGDYDVFQSPLEDFRRAAERAGLQQKVVYPPRGESFGFSLKDSRKPAETQMAM